MVGLTVPPFRRVCRRVDESLGERRVKRLLLFLLVVPLIAAACGSYASQAGKYLTEARSEMLGSAYALDRFADGEVSGAFLRASLEQYAAAMKSTTQSIKSLKPPPGARKEHQREVEALSRAQTLMQKAGQQGVQAGEAPKFANKLRNFVKELHQ